MQASKTNKWKNKELKIQQTYNKKNQVLLIDPKDLLIAAKGSKDR